MNDFLEKVRVLDGKTFVFLWAIQDSMRKIAYNTSSIEGSFDKRRYHFIPLLFGELSGDHLVGQRSMKEVLKQFRQAVLSH